MFPICLVLLRSFVDPYGLRRCRNLPDRFKRKVAAEERTRSRLPWAGVGRLNISFPGLTRAPCHFRMVLQRRETFAATTSRGREAGELGYNHGDRGRLR